MKYLEIKGSKYTLRGMCHESSKENAYPVIIVHGYFSANRVGPQRLFFKMAEAISKIGFDVYRFDLSGMGESDGNISDVTFSNHVEDIYEIIKYVQSVSLNKRVCVIAHCLGCSATLSNIISNPNLFREIVFLAPYYTTNEILTAFFSKESIAQLSNESYTYRKGLFAHASFFNESKQEDFVRKLKETPVTLNVIVPEKDQFIPVESSKKIFDTMPTINTVYLPEADHNFLETNEMLISCVLEMLSDEKFTI